MIFFNFLFSFGSDFFCCGGKKQKPISKCLFLCEWDGRLLNGEDALSAFFPKPPAITWLCPRLFFFYSCCCWESRSSQACPRPAYQLAKKPFTCKPGQHFIVFFLWEIMRACINVWHSCRVMSSLRSWLLSSGTCCNARDQPRHSRSALPPTGVVARVVYERARFRRRLDFWWENWIEHWWDLKRFRFFFCGFCFE